MKNESIRKSIIVGVFVIAVFALTNSMSQEKIVKVEEVTYYPITEIQSANVLGATDSILNVFDGAIPGCIGSVNNSSNTNNCVVTGCDGGVNIGNSALTDSEVFNCVAEEYWEGFNGEYTQEELGCLAGQCLLHATDDTSSTLASAVKDGRGEIDEDDMDTTIPDCVDGVFNITANTCMVTDCDGVNHQGEYGSALTDEQFGGCLGDTPYDSATAAQLGCLANECLNHENAQSSNVPVALESIQPGQSNATIYIVETKLKEKGFFNLVPDAVHGYKTIEAIKLFQASVRLPITGTLDQKTLTEIFK